MKEKNKRYSKRVKKIILNFLLFICMLLIFKFLLLEESVYAVPKEPAFVSKTYFSFKSIQKYILKISTPAAAVAIGFGILMQKFSFGDEEKIRTSKKIVRSTLFAYALILSTDLILSFIRMLIR